VTIESTNGERRSVHRSVSSGGSFGASPLEQHVGLGRARTVDVDIWWPATNTRQHFGGIGRNQIVEITEGQNEYRIVRRATVRLGGAK
jgi:ASPIC/UnbV protein